MSEQPKKQENHLTEDEAEDVRSLSRLRAPAVYSVVRREGEDELVRPATSLWWSGLAAGIGISTSVFVSALLHQHLPDAEWTRVVESFGYTTGFLIVVLGRMQLFTENTITAVLPVLSDVSKANLTAIGRLWAIVLVANLVGSFAAACLATWGVATPDQLAAAVEFSRHAVAGSPFSILLRAIPAGFFVAAMVWMMASSRERFWIVVTMTYIIAVGGFPHVIAGSAEAYLLLLSGDFSLADTFLGFIGPALIGNIIGGTVLFTLLAYGQVAKELD